MIEKYYAYVYDMREHKIAHAQFISLKYENHVEKKKISITRIFEDIMTHQEGQ